MVSKTKQIKDLKLRVSALVEACKQWEEKYDVMETAFDKISRVKSENERMKMDIEMMPSKIEGERDNREITWLREMLEMLTVPEGVLKEKAEEKKKLDELLHGRNCGQCGRRY